MKNIFTIGYTAFNIDDFISVLQDYNINCVVDVRSSPFSKFYTDFNKDNLKKLLDKHNILYRHYPNEFGARQADSIFYTDGILDFEKFISSNRFETGLEKIKSGIEMGYNFVLMCAEKDPINCHRAIMLGKGFKNNDFIVKHIKSDKSLETQEELEERMIDKCFSNRFQLSMFEEIKSDTELIKEAYTELNHKIGYTLDGIDEDEE